MIDNAMTCGSFTRAPLLTSGDGRDMTTLRHDDWLDREVLVLPIDDDSLNRARVFARITSVIVRTKASFIGW